MGVVGRVRQWMQVGQVVGQGVHGGQGGSLGEVTYLVQTAGLEEVLD